MVEIHVLSQGLPFASLKVYKEGQYFTSANIYFLKINYWIKTSHTNFFQSVSCVFTDIEYITVLYKLDVFIQMLVSSTSVEIDLV